MNKESFLETLRTQYSEEIREAFLECEHQDAIDFTELNLKLQKLMKMAKSEGLPTKEFEDLVASNLPDIAISRVSLFSKKAS